MKHLVLALVCACIAWSAHRRRVESVAFASLERARDGTLVMLRAILLQPDAAACMSALTPSPAKRSTRRYVRLRERLAPAQH